MPWGLLAAALERFDVAAVLELGAGVGERLSMIAVVTSDTTKAATPPPTSAIVFRDGSGRAGGRRVRIDVAGVTNESGCGFVSASVRLSAIVASPAGADALVANTIGGDSTGAAAPVAMPWLVGPPGHETAGTGSASRPMALDDTMAVGAWL